METWNYLNMKVVPHLKCYNFGFGQNFIWTIIWIVILKPSQLGFGIKPFKCLKVEKQVVLDAHF